jgi:hypothetical protein
MFGIDSTLPCQLHKSLRNAAYVSINTTTGDRRWLRMGAASLRGIELFSTPA